MSAFKETSQLIYVVIFNKIRIHDGNDDHSIVIIEKDSTMSHYMLVIRPQPDDKGIDKIVWIWNDVLLRLCPMISTPPTSRIIMFFS